MFRDLAEIRQEAKEKGLGKMPKSEINAAVAAARSFRRYLPNRA